MRMKLHEIYGNELQISTHIDTHLEMRSNDYRLQILQYKGRLQGIASLALSPCSNAGVDEDDDTLGRQHAFAI